MLATAFLIVLAAPGGVEAHVRAENRAGLGEVGVISDGGPRPDDPLSSVAADMMLEPMVKGRWKLEGFKVGGAYAPRMVFRLLSDELKPAVLHQVAADASTTLHRMMLFASAKAALGEVDFSRSS